MKILIVDDDQAIAESLAEALEKDFSRSDLAFDGLSALELLQKNAYEIAIIDLVMPEKNGLELLKAVQENGLKTEIIMVTGFGSIETAIKAMKLGASDYLTKPINLDELRLIVKKIKEKFELRAENERLKRVVKKKDSDLGLIGSSSSIENIREIILQVAARKVTVLIGGESGTGKEVVANAIVKNSDRQAKPYLRVNCGALSQSILESELFGHEKGSFTGAIDQKKGIFEAAHQGTLFLDEIGEMPLEAQVRLLRVLESGELTRVGGVKPIEVDVRIIAATNKSLETLVKQEKFREDLYYRLNVVRIDLPPLRERREDIPFLMRHFLDLYNIQNNTDYQGFDSEVVEAFLRLDFSGNVRELKNLIERTLVFATGRQISLADLPHDVLKQEISKRGASISGTMAEIEENVIKSTLEKTGNSVKKTAEILGIPLRTLYRKIQAME